MCQYHVTFDLDLDLEHTLDAGLGYLVTIVCKFGGDPVICLLLIANYSADRHGQTHTRQTRLASQPFFQNPAKSWELIYFIK